MKKHTTNISLEDWYHIAETMEFKIGREGILYEDSERTRLGAVEVVKRRKIRPVKMIDGKKSAWFQELIEIAVIDPNTPVDAYFWTGDEQFPTVRYYYCTPASWKRIIDA